MTKAEIHKSVPIPVWQRDLLDERLAELERNPEDGAPWEEVEKRVWPAEK